MMSGCSHAVYYYFGLNKKSLAQKLSDELRFLQNSCMEPCVTVTVTAGHRSW